ncbi:MAG: KAP family NTPase, partial [Candidatus Peregrinibacteria bacterium]|nr:KAP family NTPase [Candidatus Peregrinibacteria bacterium]
MEIKIRPITIPSDSPFTNDALSREDEISNLTELLVNIETPFVLAIDSKWGTGKTTFIKMWEAELTNRNISTLYFNAWKTDFAEDPLVAFLGELNSTISTLINEESGKIEIWEKTKKLGGHIAKRGIPVAIKIATAGVVDTDALLEKEISSLSQKLAEEAVDSFNKTKGIIEEFRNNLEILFRNNSDSETNKTFIFIDELDRCRPTYALELLEKVKHILDVKNLVFILSIDKSQLCNSIKSVYGNEIDAVNYLRRFIDIEYSLKEADRESYINTVYRKFDFESFFESRKEYSDFSYEKDSFLKLFKLMTNCFRLSLREIEQYLTKIYLVILSTKQNIHLYSPILVALIFLKETNSNLYKEYKYLPKGGDSTILYFRS